MLLAPSWPAQVCFPCLRGLISPIRVLDAKKSDGRPTIKASRELEPRWHMMAAEIGGSETRSLG